MSAIEAELHPSPAAKKNNYGAGNLYVETGETKDASAGTDVKTTAMGVSYKIGALNTYLELNTVKESATADDDQTIVGVEYAF